MRETAGSMGERILAYSHDTGLDPAMRRIARKTTFASAYGISRREPSFSRLLRRPVPAFRRLPRAGDLGQGRGGYLPPRAGGDQSDHVEGEPGPVVVRPTNTAIP